MKKFLLLLASGYLLFAMILAASHAQGIKYFSDAWLLCVFGVIDAMGFIVCIKHYWEME